MSGGPERKTCRTKASELRRIRALNPNFGRLPWAPRSPPHKEEYYPQNQMDAPDYNPWPDLERTPSVEMDSPENAGDTIESGPPAPPDSPQIGFLANYPGRDVLRVGNYITAPNGVRGRILSLKGGMVKVRWERRARSAPAAIECD